MLLRWRNKSLLYILLSFGALISVFPFYWMFVIATSHTSAVNQSPPAFIPGGRFFGNFQRALDDINFGRALYNSAVVSISVTLGVLFFCALAGFAFSKFNFPLKNFLFFFLLATLAVPTQLSLIPSYIIIVKLNMLDTLSALIVPGLVSAFGIFWMRQYIDSAIHDELIEAGWIDGCTNFRIFCNIVVPAILPAFATLGMLTFLNTWNDFLWPLVVLKSSENFTIQIALNSLIGMPQDRDYGRIMAATFVATIPLIFIFLFFRRYFISGLTAGAVKS